MKLCEGRRKDETREQGLSRRAKASRKITMACVKKFKEDEARLRAAALKVVEEKLGGFDDRPL